MEIHEGFPSDCYGSLSGEVLGRQIEQPVDEPILLAKIMVADPPRLTLANHVHRYGYTLNCRESGRVYGLTSGPERVRCAVGHPAGQ